MLAVGANNQGTTTRRFGARMNLRKGKELILYTRSMTTVIMTL